MFFHRYINMFLSNKSQFLIFLIIIRNVCCINSFQHHEPEIFSLNTKHGTKTNTAAADFLNLFGIEQKQVLQQHTFPNIQKGKVEALSKLLKVHVDQLRNKSEEVELVFLVDASASVGLENFQSELNFVRKLLSDFTVSPDSTRVAVVTFGGKTSIVRHIDQISTPDVNNHKCRLLNQQLGSITYSGGGTYTRGALLEAHNILERSRSGARKAVFLITDGFSNGGDPRPAATLLKKVGVVVFTFGIRTGNIEELHHIASEPGYTHLLDSFPEFEALARKALHHDLKTGQYVATKSSQECDSLCTSNAAKNNAVHCCDSNASCACGIVTGHYACLCHPGYYGSGLNGSCQPCPNGTFGLGISPGDSNTACIPCPDLNHVTLKKAATTIGDCSCAAGFKTDGTKCVALTCPKLQVPENGYLVKANACNNVLNAACGIRCHIGFHLTGDSIRLCLKTGAWSGTAPQCLLKTCPALQAPTNGSIHCEHEDERQVINTQLSAFPIDTYCEYKCDPGYQLRGSRSRNCLPLSRWDGLKVSCRSIKCQPLKSVRNGEIIPESCTISNKIYFGTKCVIRCKEGFTREGPEKRICSGHTGTWSHRHSVTQCIDTTPPTITCPNNITLQTLPGRNHAVANWKQVVAADNAESPPTVWSEPFVTAGKEMGIGVHVITYNAQDANKNRAQCYFRVTVLDKEPPTVENCVDPPVFLLQSGEAATNISWDEPVFYDNSGLPIEISRSHVPGEQAFGFGVTKIVYVATDRSNNTKTCVFNVTVEDACANLPSLENGHSNCARLQDGVQCAVTCAEGYAFALPESVLHSNDENLTLTCNKNHHSWNVDAFPDCSVTQVPYAIAQDFTVSFIGNTSNCRGSAALNAITRNIETGLESRLREMCDDGMECNVLQSDLICKDKNDEESNVREKKSSLRLRRATRYSKLRKGAMVTEVSEGNTKKRKPQKDRKKNGGQKWDKTEVKYKIIGKMIENHKNNSKKGMAKLKERLERMVKNGRLNLLNDRTNQELGKLEIRLDVIFQEPKELCYNGSILRKNSCVKCPLGTFHNVTRNQCQSCPFQEYQDDIGSISCKRCPKDTSTRKMHSKSLEDCIDICRPGYYSRRKRHHKAPLALAPCVTCGVGFYQPKYAQPKCIPCPTNTTTVARGAKSIDECLDPSIARSPCNENPCLNGGNCTIVNNNDFTCRCIGNFIGSTCEILPNPCDSSPCLNEGQCVLLNSADPSERKCLCKNGYTGVNCEVYIDECSMSPCQNNGTCISTEEDFECICPNGFEGEVCEIEIDHCSMSPCESNSMCSTINGTWQCECKPGYIGRRCSRLPCDWLPCHANAICINIPEFNATKNSYRCECPEGYTGRDCTTRINHCENFPCMNNGTCLNNLLDYTCECRNGFNGSNCENELSSAYVMNFPRSGTTDYVMVKGSEKNLSELTLCLWLQSVDTFNYGTVVSYATYLHDNALTLTDYNGFVIYVNGNRVVTDVTVNDGFWHFVCVTWGSLSGSWSVFVDGILRENGSLLANGTQIEGNGILVVGQEQDVLGGGFSESESLVGKLSLLDIWDEVLENEVIMSLATKCESYHGSLYSWAQLQGHIRGNVENSSFCKACPLPTIPSRGSVEANEDGSEIVYTCEKGYVVKFGKNESPKLRRKCLKQAEWEGYHTPTCTKVKCGFPGYFPRGRLLGKSYTYGDRIRYSCAPGYKLRGNPQRTCTAYGTWSGIQPLCIGTTCKNLLAPNNGDIEYLVEEYERDDTSILQVGQQLEFKCAPGFRLLGSLLLTCLQNGSWDNAVPQCIAFGCPPPELIDNGYIASNVSTGVEMLPHILASSQMDSSSAGDTDSSNSGYLYGDIVGFSCHPGYKFLGNRNLITEFRMQCTDNGTWIGIVPDCVPLHCPRPEPVKNSRTYLLSGNNMTEISKSETFGNLTFINKLVPISDKPLPTFDGPFDVPISTDELNVSNLPNNLPKRNTMLEEFQAEFNVSFVLSTQILTVCNRGYRLVGAAVRNCTINETWSLAAPSCEKQECEMAGHPLIDMLSEKKNGIEYDGVISPDLEGSDFIKNLRGNTRLQGTLNHFAFSINGGFFGDVISLKCLNETKIDFRDVGMVNLLENFTWICNEHGKWETVSEKPSSEEVQRRFAEKKDDFCQYATCNSPEVPTNGYIPSDGTSNSSKIAGDLVTYKCRQGYSIMKGSESVKCLPDGTWSSVPNCEPVDCGKPPTPLNAVLDDSSAEAVAYVFGNMVSYRCVPGYKMYGRGSARCVASGKWSRMNGRCSRISCGKPVVPPGVTTTGPSFLYEAYLTFSCPDKKMEGKIRCNSDGKWSKFPDC